MEEARNQTIYFITGASGVGKTTLVHLLREKYHNQPWSFFHFDSGGVPSLAQMEKEYGSPAAWQKAKTLEWIHLLVQDGVSTKIFMEGQTNPQFIQEGFAQQNFKNFKIILLDCPAPEVKQRLTIRRNQPELFTPHLVNWLNYLRAQAREQQIPIIETQHLTPPQLLAAFEKVIAL
ncbi:AAA family ATPase [Adhaeribacter swui]|uniref:AAA family ATPase n=1 Tax=Adhaeribacter swui TaxID=2086471 RepID=A0A7G7GC70_9BACT|nr:AAA family ATPase [Adhaeribacter swui]QNF34754.1 AAA family ATPase [Adhaeribacter swui]